MADSAKMGRPGSDSIPPDYPWSFLQLKERALIPPKCTAGAAAASSQIAVAGRSMTMRTDPVTPSICSLSAEKLPLLTASRSNPFSVSIAHLQFHLDGPESELPVNQCCGTRTQLEMAKAKSHMGSDLSPPLIY